VEETKQERVGAILVGCGAIAASHAQAFMTEGVKFLALVDPVPARADALARSLGIQAQTATEVTPRLLADTTLAVVCSPPWEHARQCVELLDAGLHVLCEKPLALKAADVKVMSAAAARNSRILGAAQVRRFFGQSETLRELIDSQILGAPTKVRVRESMFGWPLSKAMLDPAGSPVGTLADSGPHVLDLIHSLFGPVTIESYEDNAEIGEESFCHLGGKAREVTIEIYLMRRVAVSPRWTIEFQRGAIVFNPRLHGQLDLFGKGITTPLKSDKTQDPFRLQASNFLAALAGRGAFRVPLSESEATAARIDECHARRDVRPVPRGSGQVDTLVTGGTGNIGGRLVELLAAKGELHRYRFLIRSFDNAADLCRLGATLVVGDLTRDGALENALSGCTNVLHLGAGAEPGRETRTLALAARKAGIRRFVHFSTANVFGMDLDPGIERLQEATRLEGTGDTYCDGKAEAERVLWKFADLNPIFLRPHIVYGPGMRWTFDLANQLEQGRLAVLDHSGIANLIFVDDLVECALHMLGTTVGGAYFVTDNAPVSWSHYIDLHAAGLGYQHPPRCRRPPRSSAGILDALAASGRSFRRVLASDAFREFLTQDPLARATLFRLYLGTRNTGPMKKVKSNLQQVRSLATRNAPSAQWLSLQTSDARLSSARLFAATGFKASWPFERGLAASLEWLKSRGY